MRRSVFGTLPDGREVEALEIAGGGLSARFLTYGAVLQDLRLEAHAPALVLGFESLDRYLAHSPYFGATAGRCANRIRDGRFTIDGADFEANRNAGGGHCLHGGRAGIGKRLWSVVEHAPEGLSLAISLEDGEMGFPGAMEVVATFTLSGEGRLDIRYEATTDAPTLCNLAHHTYFALDDSGGILDHELTIAADRFLPADGDFLATGEVRPVEGSGWDFRDGLTIREANDALGPIDTNFCLSNERLPRRTVGCLRSALSGVAMEIETTEPGLQVYDAARIDVPVPGLDGRRMGNYAGLALEPQVWPDAINHPDWPQPVLRPGERYVQDTAFVFGKESR